MKTLILSLGLFGALLSGCNDPEAPSKCRAIGSAYCKKVVDFCDDTTAPVESLESCEQTYDEAVICNDALYLEEEEEVCLLDIADIQECTFAIPTTCIGVVVVAEKAEAEAEEDES